MAEILSLSLIGSVEGVEYLSTFLRQYLSLHSACCVYRFYTVLVLFVFVSAIAAILLFIC